LKYRYKIKLNDLRDLQHGDIERNPLNLSFCDFEGFLPFFETPKNGDRSE